LQLPDVTITSTQLANLSCPRNTSLAVGRDFTCNSTYTVKVEDFSTTYLKFDVAANISGMALDAGQATTLNLHMMWLPITPNMQFDVDVVASTCMQLSVQGVSSATGGWQCDCATLS
jgi:hypothetical protein